MAKTAYSDLNTLKTVVSVDRLIPLVDDEKLRPNTIDISDPQHAAMVERINKVISDADAVIDAYIGGRYKLPLQTIPELLKTISAELAYYRLLAKYNPKIEDSWQEIYNNHISLLKRISEGKAVLDGLVLSSIDSQAVTGEFVAGEDPIFSRQSLKEF